MDVRRGTPPPDLDDELADDLEAFDDRGDYEPRYRRSLDGFSIAGITRRRIGWLAMAILSAWILLVFARQVADTAAKAAEADRARVANAQVAQTVADLQREF